MNTEMSNTIIVVIDLYKLEGKVEELGHPFMFAIVARN